MIMPSKTSKKRIALCRVIGRRAGRFAEDTDGVSLVEFAFMFPILLMILMMTISLSHMMMIDRKVTVAAQSAADLIAQRQAVDPGDIVEIQTAVGLMMQPFAANFDMSIAHVPFDVPAGDADMGSTAAWRAVINGAPQIPSADAEAAADGDNVQAPTGVVTGKMGGPGDALIMLRMNYLYQSIWGTDFSMLGLTIPGILVFRKEAFSRPRLNRQIASTATLITVN